MKKSSLLLLVLVTTFLTLSVSLHAEELQKIFFARSGQRVRIPGTEQLRLLDTRLQVGTKQRGGLFLISKLRAPSLVGAYDSSDKLISEFVAYPEKMPNITTKSGKTPFTRKLVKPLDPPDWFWQWAEATRLFDGKTIFEPPVKEKKTSGAMSTTARSLDMRTRVNSPYRNMSNDLAVVDMAPRLLIVGAAAAGESPRAILDLLEKHSAETALVFNPRWSGEAHLGPISLVLDKATGTLLEDYRAMGDSAPLKFSRVRTPCPAMMNRLGWLRAKQEPKVFDKSKKLDDLSYVEELFLDARHRIIVSYLPWEEVLGRSDQADHLFRHLLVKALEQRLARLPATGEDRGEKPVAGDGVNEPVPELNATIELAWPRRWDIREAERPIVSQLLKRQASPSSPKKGPVLHLVDLRGERPVQQAKRDELLKALARRPLLILGTDPVLEEEELRRHVQDPGVTWLEDGDALPSDAVRSYRLMETLTKLGVALFQP